MLCKNAPEKNSLLTNLPTNILAPPKLGETNLDYSTNRRRSSSISNAYLTRRNEDFSNTLINRDSNYNLKNQPSTSEDRTWKEVSSKKRPRKNPENQTRNQKQTRLNNYWLSATISTSNKFTVLGNEDPCESDTETAKSSPKPPPIYVGRVKNIISLTNLLNDIAKDNYVLKVLRDEEIKIQPKTTQDYS